MGSRNLSFRSSERWPSLNVGLQFGSGKTVFCKDWYLPSDYNLGTIVEVKTTKKAITSEESLFAIGISTINPAEDRKSTIRL